MSATIPIIIPTFNAVHHLRRCVQTVEERTKAPYQLYIADDCSPSTELHSYLDKLAATGCATVFKKRTRVGFAGINNWAASQIPASPFLCLLNSDIEPTPGWLTHLLAELEADSRIGIVGARLLFPDNQKKSLRLKIQHAGVARNSEGQPYHPFRGELAAYAPAAKRRELNAVTAACMLVRRTVWTQLGGFKEYGQGQYEDVDFCWRARRAGWKVVYQPKAVLYHFEHGSGGPSERLLARNRARLRSMWPGLRSDEHLFEIKATKPKPESNKEKAVAVPEKAVQNIPPVPPAEWRATPALVTIVILNWNTEELLPDCIGSIRSKTVYPYELIVVDNGSMDGSVSWLRQQPDLKLIENERNLGWSVANNQGIRASRGECCLLLNSDTIVRTKGWLKNMVRSARPSNVATVGAKLLYPDGKIQHIGGSIHDTNPFHPFDGAPADIKVSLRSRDVPFNTGACLLIKKSTLQLVGLLDEGYVFGYADVDYGMRCLEAGLRNVYCSPAVLTHLWAYTQRKTKKWIPTASLVRFKQLWAKKISSLAPKDLMDFMWPVCANWIRKAGPGSHIHTIRNKETEKALSWGGIG